MTDDPARIRQAVLDWVREDCGQAIKMNVQRHHIERLVERICNPQPAIAATKPQPIAPVAKKKGRPKA